MRVVRLDLEDCAMSQGTAIVIDVIRAFTTAAIAFERGAARIIFVADSDKAFQLKHSVPEVLIMGEEHGLPPEGYDFGNSPVQLMGADLAGRTLVQRTSNGTQGLVRCTHCDAIYAGSFLTAAATVAAIRGSGAETVSIINTGARDDWSADEDAACGDYLEMLLMGHEVDPAPYLQRVNNCEIAHIFTDPERTEYAEEDLAIAQHLDRWSKPIQVVRDGEFLVARVN